MTITTAGRIALFANLALSLLFAFWGFAIYSQRVNWSDKKIGDREGEFSKRADAIKLLQDRSRPRVQKRWRDATTQVVTLEALRPEHLNWYSKQIEILKTGDAKQKILGVGYEQGQILFDRRTGLPVRQVITDQTKHPIEGLASLRVLNEEYGRLQQEIVTITADIEELTRQEKTLTEQLGDGQARGLRFDLAQQQRAEKNSLDEQEYLQPLLYNSMVEQLSLEDRQKVLEDRVKRLQTVTMAKQP
jgi:hypothetical protein